MRESAVLHDLEAVREGREPRQGYLRRAVTALVDLHSQAPTGALQPHFVKEASDLLAQVRAEVAVLVGLSAYDVEVAAPEDLYDMLVLRSALQYLRDDFRGTPAADLVAPQPLVELDKDLERLVREHGPVSAERTPKRLPTSHWWWQVPPQPDRSAGS